MGIFEYGCSEGGLHPKKIKNGITNNIRSSHKRHARCVYFALCVFLSSVPWHPPFALLHPSPHRLTVSSRCLRIQVIGTFALKWSLGDHLSLRIGCGPALTALGLCYLFLTSDIQINLLQQWGKDKWLLLLSFSRNLNKSFSSIIAIRAALANASVLELRGVHTSGPNLLFP